MREIAYFLMYSVLLLVSMSVMAILAAAAPETAELLATGVLVVSGLAVIRPFKTFGLSNRFFSLLLAIFVGGFGMLMAQADLDNVETATSVRHTTETPQQPPSPAPTTTRVTVSTPTHERPRATLPIERQAKLEAPKPEPPSTVVPVPEPVFQRRVMYVNASRLNVRGGPDTSFSKVTSLERNEKVLVTGREGDWLKVQTGRTEGWVFGSYLTSQKPPERRKVVRQQPVKPELTTAEIKQILIRQSRASYSGRCPCPYDRKSNGHRCGRTSAYSRPGGASPLCFEHDVTDQMVARLRARQ